MPSTHEQVTTWQGLGRENSVFKPHKPLPRKRDTTISSVTSPDLRAQYRSSSNGALNGNGQFNGSYERPGSSLMHGPTTPVLPPTPPIANHENTDFSNDESSVADTTILRSSVVTPINQQSPPTPDQTPPRLGKDFAVRPWLATQPSMASTRAESFATAREEFQSDTESENSAPRWVHSRSRNASHHSIPVPRVPEPFQLVSSPLVDNTTPRTPQAVWEDDEVWASHEAQQESGEEPPVSFSPEPYVSSCVTRDTNESEEYQIMLEESPEFDSPTLPQHAFATPTRTEEQTEAHFQKSKNGIESSSSFRSRLPRPVFKSNGSERSGPEPSTEEEIAPRRGLSLRDRLEAVDRGAPNASTENFADEIGWSETQEETRRSNLRKSWRLSGVSAISTVDAMVFDTEPRRTKTIRRQTKTNSLRIASSPLPNSNRSSIQTNPYASLESPPRHSLSHKKARLSNQNRLSYGSNASRSLSMSSAATPSKAEVIRVAVIPQRRSSLQSSVDSSRRHSMSHSLTSSGRGRFPSLRHSMHTHRLSSDGGSIGSCETCGKTKRYPPTVPPRASSLSAPTSRNNSKANSRSNSITSDHFRVHRLQAERDLRKTLDKMESERVAPSLKAMTDDVEENAEQSPAEPGTEKWASLRPTSVLDTPFSQPSMLSASGDGASIEMGEARAVNLFPHNNDSLQLIEKHPLTESRAVRSLRHTNPAQDLSILIDGSSTPRAIAADVPVMDSPLRNPRSPPQIPDFRSDNLTPSALPLMSIGQSQSQGQTIKRYRSLGRPSLAAQRYSASFIKSVTRGLSLKNARNPKSDSPQLDEKLTPMWRPRRFWDDAAEYTEDESEDYSEDEGEVRNSLGMPQKRTVVTGPVSLIRSLSQGRSARKQNRQLQQRNRGIYQQRSYGSLGRLRTARKMYKVPGFRGVHFQFISLSAWQERMRVAKNRKDDEQREARRRMLREAIGPNVISQGDSRFPDTMAATNTGQDMVEGSNLQDIN